MALAVFLLVMGVLFEGEALHCGIHSSSTEMIKNTLSKCVNNNKTLEELWDLTSMSSESDSSSSSSSSEEDDDVNTENPHTPDARTSRSANLTPQLEPDDNSYTTELVTPSTVPEITTTRTTENCVVQCIFHNLEMTDPSGYPDHGKVLESLLKNNSESELRDFFQDITDECFQDMEKDNLVADSCSFSTKLVTCMADKGKANCSDWPIGNLPFHQQ